MLKFPLYGSGGNTTTGNGSGSKSGSDFYYGPPREGLGVYRSMQLTAAGCEKIYQDEGESGGKRNRPQLNKALDHIRKGDVLIVCKLDRLSRSLVDLLDILKRIESAGAAIPQFRRNL